MADVPGSAERTDTVRLVDDPASTPCFRDVAEIRHFPNGDVLLRRDGHRDCLLSDVDLVDVPVTAARREAESEILETDTTTEVTDEGGTRTLRELRLDASLG